MTQGDEIGVLEPAAPPISSCSTPRPSPTSASCRTSGGCARSISPARNKIADRPYDPRQVTDFALSNWTDVYTQARVAELGIGQRRLAAE